MSQATLIPRKNLLGKLIGDPGGSKLADMLKRADENLESIRADCLNALDRHLDGIAQLRAEAGGEPSLAVKDSIYQLSGEIHGVAGVFGFEALGEAAFSLCELTDRLRRSGRWAQDAIDVHIGALRLLRHPESLGDAAVVLGGLRQVLERFPAA